MKLYLGWDDREAEAFEVARQSIFQFATRTVDIEKISLKIEPYRRHTEWRDGRMWDLISEASMSTAHAIARFFVPYIQGYKGWALFMDSDILCRDDIQDLMDMADPGFAVQVVKHCYYPPGTTKKDGAVQTRYTRKNWSSVMLWNCGHPANERLDLKLLNSAPGRDLHRFCWLEDQYIGSLPERWNWLVNHSSEDISPAIVHFTEGLPSIEGHESDPYAGEWLEVKNGILRHA